MYALLTLALALVIGSFAIDSVQGADAEEQFNEYRKCRSEKLNTNAFQDTVTVCCEEAFDEDMTVKSYAGKCVMDKVKEIRSECTEDDWEEECKKKINDQSGRNGIAEPDMSDFEEPEDKDKCGDSSGAIKDRFETACDNKNDKNECQEDFCDWVKN